MIKKFLNLCLMITMASIFQLSQPAEASADRCHRLANQVQSWQRIRDNYVRRWNRCRDNLGWSHLRCRNLRNQVNQWYSNVRTARANYRAWGCTFAWDRWDNPWSHRPPTVDNSARCQHLANQVQSWQATHSGYVRRWNRCRDNLGWSHPRCRNLRERVNQWYSNVRTARANYNAWGCTFTWDRWNNPWSHRPPAVDNSARCQQLASQVQSWQTIHSRYVHRWNRCRDNLGWSHSRCRNLRAQVNQWYSNVRTARANYRAWGCQFAWNRWDSPWSQP
jgi:hypothetical protein